MDDSPHRSEHHLPATTTLVCGSTVDTGSNYATQTDVRARHIRLDATERETGNAFGMKVRAAASDPENALNFGGICVLIPDYRGANVNKSSYFTIGGKCRTILHGLPNNGTGEWDKHGGNHFC